ncbi:MAG: protein kinase [Acidobacteria bacterium]|nr:protein kinase [Acidobacteriota bacterium]
MKQCPKCNAQYSNDQAICPIDAGVLIQVSDTKNDQTNSDPMIGRLIADKYRVEKLLGRGGMGAVYEGQHLLLDRRVAIKVLQQNMANDEQAASRFIREAKASARIEHPNAVTIYDFGVLQEGSAYLVMEFIRGFSLRQMLVKKDPLRAEQIADWMIQVCSVVEAAHQQGIIHRDLKPENVMLKESPDGSVAVKVVDFGLAKLTSESTTDKASAHLTKPGEMLGTPHYMAPEYYEGETIDKRADIYAIGIMMYELFCGDTPFTGTVQSIIGGHLFKDPLPIIKANPTIHPALDEVVQKALKKNRSERISSASELAQELKQALQKAKEFFLQKTAVDLDPLVNQANTNKPAVAERSTLMDSESPLLKTEKVIPNSRPTIRASKEENLPAVSRPTQHMAFGTMQVDQEFVDIVKEKQQKNPLQNPIAKDKEINKEINKSTDKEADDLIELDAADLEPIEPDSGSFTSAPTKAQPERLRPAIIIPPSSISPLTAPLTPMEPDPVDNPVTPVPDTVISSPITPPKVLDTVPATTPVARVTPVSTPSLPLSSPTIAATTSLPNNPIAIPVTNPIQDITPKYESFSEALSAIKGQLLIGSIIVFLLAIVVTLLIIYRLEVS